MRMSLETGKRLGPSLGYELDQAGVTQVSWTADGVLTFDDEVVTEAERAVVLAAIEAHDPDAAPPKSGDEVARDELAALLTDIEADGTMPTKLRELARLLSQTHV
jgi:hypothetical protein